MGDDDFRLLTCGGRDYVDAVALFSALDMVHEKRPVTTIIHGGASGADRLSSAWAESRGVTVEVFPADWKRLGKSAGPIRNQRMIDKGRPDGVVAFPGRNGTGDMIGRAYASRIPVWLPYGAPK